VKQFSSKEQLMMAIYSWKLLVKSKRRRRRKHRSCSLDGNSIVCEEYFTAMYIILFTSQDNRQADAKSALCIPIYSFCIETAYKATKDK
jgi:hypothetical protein